MFDALRLDRDPEFMVIQSKYAYTRTSINEKYTFLLRKGYEVYSMYRNIDIWEEYEIGWDSMILMRLRK